MTACTLAHPYQSGRIGRDGGGEPLRPGGTALTQRAIRAAGFLPGQRVLDLGCGSGVGSRQLQEHGCLPCAVDIAADAVAGLAGIPGLVADAARLPLADGAFDGILAECSLSLAGYRAGALAECRRVLRPGGILAITDVFARAEAASPFRIPGCLAELAGRGTIVSALAAAGFELLRWEDHSELLKSFLARLIFAGGSLADLWSNDGTACLATLRAARPGYFLLIAQRRP